MKRIANARFKTIINIDSVHEALCEVDKEISRSNDVRRRKVQRVPNALTYVLALRICLGDYVMVRTHEKRKHKLQKI